MSKVVIYTDLHAESKRVDLEKVIGTITYANNLAKERGAVAVLNLGDTLDFFNHTKSKMKISPELMSLINRIGTLMEGHLVLRGNHEYHEEGDLIQVFDIFGAQTICEPLEMEIDGKSILFMPYYDNKDVDSINFKFKEKYDYVFGHFDITGASFESGFKDMAKDSEILHLFDFVKMYIGHYHIRQQIRSNIWSVGSTQSRVKTNNETTMGFTILDIETGDIEFVENPYAEYVVSDTKVTIGSKYEASKKYNLLDEIENFKLEKTGLDVIIDYTENKRGVYDEAIIDYTLDYLEGLKKV